MHFPQLPDPSGWDVAFFHPFLWVDPEKPNDPPIEKWQPIFPADDWRCSQDGPVSDIHFWVSMRGDDVTEQGVVPFTISSVQTRIYGDIPATASGLGFSVPNWDGPTWDRVFSQDQIQVRYAGSGTQGWFDPYADPATIRPDHYNFYQVNIPLIENPFYQKQGNIYWLELLVDGYNPLNGNRVELGWKTANMNLYPPDNAGVHFMDDATYAMTNLTNPGLYSFEELWLDNQSRDLAFVITPEPGSIVMLVGAGLFGLAAFARRRRRA
jgi:hypothetical protein